MYMNFYKLSKAPFHITPDPDFLFLSPSHKEALGSIIYCVEERKGFVSVVGEVGTGKTTIIRAFLARCDRTLVKPIYVFNAGVSFQELLKTILHELGIDQQNDNVYVMSQQLHLVLISEYKEGHNIVLIIDEAQHMPVDTLEKLRLLSNFETSKEKLIQIVLVGQPELSDKLKLNELRQLNQRLAVRATLLPLTKAESHEYILHRLSKLTPNPEQIFTPRALERIVKTCQGSPRRLNILCDNILVAGFGYRERQISDNIAKQVIADFEGKDENRFLNWRLAASFVVFCLLGLAVNDFFRSSFSDILMNPPDWITRATAKAPALIAMENQPALTSAHQAGETIAKDVEGGGELTEDAPCSDGGIATAPFVTDQENETVSDSRNMDLVDSDSEVFLTPAIPIEVLGGQGAEAGNLVTTAHGSDIEREKTTGEKAGEMSIGNRSPVALPSNLTDSHSNSSLVTIDSAMDLGKLEREIDSSPSQIRQREVGSAVPTFHGSDFGREISGTAGQMIDDEKLGRELEPQPSQTHQEDNTISKVRTIKRGEYLSQICLEIYGRYNDLVIQKIKEENPNIKNADLIVTGEEIVFPKLLIPEERQLTF